MMQADGGDSPAQQPDGGSKSPRWLERVKTWDSRFSVAKGLTMVTFLTGFLGGYFQYLNSYEEKVSTLAKDDMAAATATFLEISNAFAHAQMLQQLIYFAFADVLRDQSDDTAPDRAMTTKSSRDIFPDYVKTRNELRQNSNVLARKAEIYVDWASDLSRDPASARPLNADPLSEVKLGNYNFDCDNDANLPHFYDANAKRENRSRNASSEDPCVAGEDANKDSKKYLNKSYVRLCSIRDGKIIKSDPVMINWYSAKHHVVTMHYCFEVAHRTIETARVWASNNEPSETKKTKFLEKDEADLAKARLNTNVLRLNAFMSLAMSQIERIRVKYRPAGFFCHIPPIGLLIKGCTPIRTAVSESD